MIIFISSQASNLKTQKISIIMEAMENLKLFLQKCIRVWHVLKKPDMDEYKTISKVSALGILAIGLIGFAIGILINLFR